MKSITYVSSATHLFTTPELVTLLEQSRDRNLKHDITGMLLYNAGSFMQAIEGPDDAIDRLFANIQQDSRNKLVMKLLDDPVEAREFPSWSMGFYEVNNRDLLLVPAFTSFLAQKRDPRGFATSGSEAKKLLLNFRTNATR